MVFSILIVWEVDGAESLPRAPTLYGRGKTGLVRGTVAVQKAPACATVEWRATARRRGSSPNARLSRPRPYRRPLSLRARLPTFRTQLAKYEAIGPLSGKGPSAETNRFTILSFGVLVPHLSFASPQDYEYTNKR